ncbi:hypothetical protein [Streptomyces hiroshimensis]|uniref:Uncharacterized protein n=1 Tax=Streptomyces hiroshimensis TaxID=66424 RepID=A0ABQ2Z0P4_9ACTN|nr:hypothetical protein [Streptomyces hiroshimensis]GGX98272.1 hypothetical protein GCM10010324_50830 [Streptomyces hiroshimensis]
MVVFALALPPLLLCGILALGRYEERILTGPVPPRRAPGRHRGTRRRRRIV